MAGVISTDWKRLGRWLLESEPAASSIDEKYTSCYEKVYQVLTQWIQAKGSSAVFRDLYQALCGVGRRDLAEKFCCDGQ